MTSFGVIAACGVRSEARAAERAGLVIAVCGGGRSDQLERAFRAAFSLVDFVDDEVPGPPSIGGIVSFGLCGALDPALPLGSIVMGSSSDADWSASVRARLGSPPVTGDVFSDGILISTTEEKAALRARTGAVAVDMESHIAGRIAAERELPFLILRVVLDRADQALPAAFARAMRPDGGTDLPAMLASLARQPGQLPRVIGASADALRALASLRRLSRLLGPGLGFPDFA